MATIQPQRRSLAEIKSKLLNPATTSHFQVNVGSPSRADGTFNRFLRESGVNFPKMALGSYHSYFSRHNKNNWYQVSYVIHPKLINGPKSKFFTEDTSEYHKYNIEKHPNHKKAMEKFISLASIFHQKFEFIQKAQKHHLLDLSKHLTKDVEVKSMNKDIVRQLKELNDLYKSGALSGYEFEKAKKKLLNN